uniref:Transcription factor-like protein DPB isoform X1 n=1 Tax=Rhizophora mucronata TaxID=61149 RepID=A0A2P2LPF0_RHIMU
MIGGKISNICIFCRVVLARWGPSHDHLYLLLILPWSGGIEMTSCSDSAPRFKRSIIHGMPIPLKFLGFRFRFCNFKIIIIIIFCCYLPDVVQIW